MLHNSTNRFLCFEDTAHLVQESEFVSEYKYILSNYFTKNYSNYKIHYIFDYRYDVVQISMPKIIL